MRSPMKASGGHGSYEAEPERLCKRDAKAQFHLKDDDFRDIFLRQHRLCVRNPYHKR